MAPTTADCNELLLAGLAKELRSRPEIIATSPASTTTSLTQTLASCLHNINNNKTSPRSAKVPPAHSSDSSMGEMEKTAVAETGNANQQPISLSDALGSGTSRLLAGSSRPPSVPGRTGTLSLTGKVAKTGLGPSVPSLGVATSGKVAKSVRKRVRQSKKPFTMPITASKEEFRAKVQELTGYRPPPSAPLQPLGSSGLQPISRPQPLRPSVVPMDRDVKVPVVKIEGPSPNAFVKVPAVESEVPIVKPSSTLPIGGLNYCMGFDSLSFTELLLLNEAMQEDHGQQNDFLNQGTTSDDHSLEKKFFNQGTSSDEHSLQKECLNQATPSDDCTHQNSYFHYENDFTSGDQLGLMPLLNAQQQQLNERLEGSSYFKGVEEDPTSLSMESRLIREEHVQMDSLEDGEVDSWFDHPGGYVRSMNL